VADLYSKVTLRPRSQLERIVEQLEGEASAPARPPADPEEAKRRLSSLPRLDPEAVDRILLASGARVTVAPSAAARRVAVRVGYPGSTYASLTRSLDAEILESDKSDLAWRAHHLLDRLGRERCTERPVCDSCPISASCSYHGVGLDPAKRLDLGPGG
jgi:endonuclease III-like uncharacterized protein